MRTGGACRAAGAAALAGVLAWVPAAGAQIRSPFPERAVRARVETRSGPAFWMGVGLGLGTSRIGAQIEASYWQKRMYQVRATVHGAATAESGEPSDIAEVALLVGSGRPIGRNWGYASAGIGQVTGSITGGGDFSVVGLAGEAQLISQAMPHLAFGAVANLNPRASFASVTLGVLLGRMPFERGAPLRGPGW